MILADLRACFRQQWTLTKVEGHLDRAYRKSRRGVNDLDRAAAFYDRIRRPRSGLFASGQIRRASTSADLGGGGDKTGLVLEKPAQTWAPGPGFHLSSLINAHPGRAGASMPFTPPGILLPCSGGAFGCRAADCRPLRHLHRAFSVDIGGWPLVAETWFAVGRAGRQRSEHLRHETAGVDLNGRRNSMKLLQL